MAEKKITQTCSLTHCNLPHSGNGYCKPHNERIRIHGEKADLLKPIRHHKRRSKHIGCSVDGCEGEHAARGYCCKHYERWLDKGDPLYSLKGTCTNPWRITDEGFPLHFWSKASVTANPEACWEWQMTIDENGYGSMCVDGQSDKAHRVAWRLANGRNIKEGMFILHSCDNRRCVNPNHLREGTQSENMADMVLRGRSRQVEGRRKITVEEVREIKRRLQNGSRVIDVANDFRQSWSIIGNIKSGRSWKHVAI